MRKAISIIAIAAALTGCISAERVAMQSNMELCMDFLTKPAPMFGENVRAMELARRGENCSNYQELAAQQRAANERQRRALQKIEDTLGREAERRQREVDRLNEQVQRNRGFTCTHYGNVTRCN